MSSSKQLDAARRAAMAYRLRAAEAEHTGIMIALVPSAADAQRLALERGAAADDLHVTLFYYGDASAMPLERREMLVEDVRFATTRFAPLRGKTFGAGVFNPTGDEPALVLNVGGEAIDSFRRTLEGALWESPDQHRPWAAHLTLAQPVAAVELPPLEALASRMGTVVFDRVRVAFAGAAVDIPFSDITMAVETAVAARVVFDAAQAGATFLACRGAAPTLEPGFTACQSSVAGAGAVVDGDEIRFPVVAFVEGVRRPKGASGPGLFLAQDFEQALPSADRLPVVFQHPTKSNGAQYVSVNAPGPFDPETGVRVGFVTNERFEGGRMLADVVCWRSKLEQAGPRAVAMADAIVAGQGVEVSLGHFSRELKREGLHRGHPFSHVHTDVRYDHLALLPLGTPGACDWKQGCGAPRT